MEKKWEYLVDETIVVIGSEREMIYLNAMGYEKWELCGSPLVMGDLLPLVYYWKRQVQEDNEVMDGSKTK